MSSSHEAAAMPAPAPVGYDPDLAHHFRDLGQQKAAATLGMWVFLVTEIMFFGGLFGTYTIYRNLHYPGFSAGSAHLNIAIGAGNTAVLICSSLTMALAVHAAALGRRRATVLFLVGTIVLGGVFLGVKAYEYKDKFEHHLVPGPHFSAAALHDPMGRPLTAEVGRNAQIFYSLYFAMTGVHALHMIIGVPILAVIAFMASRGRFSPSWYTPVEMVGLYWHFVDIVWIFLFPLLYLVPHHPYHV
jgi:cytochrome c oxidase subunit III